MSLRPVPDQKAAPLIVSFALMAKRDLAAVSRVERECFDPPMSLSRIKNLWLRDSRFKWRVLRIKNDEGFPVSKTKTVAYACYADYGSQAHLLKLGCLEAVRGLGLGRWLLLQVLNEMTASGVQEVLLEVRESNEAARHLYRSHGFQEDGIQPRGYADNEDAVLMSIPQLQETAVLLAIGQQTRNARAAQKAGIYVLEDLHA